MNHSIYSADRMTHLKIVVVALVAGILVAGFQHLDAQLGSGRRLYPDRARDEGRQAGRDHQFEQFTRTLEDPEFTNSRWFFTAPRRPRGYLRPQLPPS